MKKILFLKNQKTSSTSTRDLLRELLGSQKNIQIKSMPGHHRYPWAMRKCPEFKNAFKFVSIRNPYSQAVSQMFKILWGTAGGKGLKFDNGVFTTKKMKTPFKLEHAIETFQLITRACYDLKTGAFQTEKQKRVRSIFKQASCKPVRDRLERLNFYYAYSIFARGERSWQVYTLNDKPMVDHYIVFHKQRQSWKGLLNKLLDKSTADELFNSDLLQHHFAQSEKYLSKYDYADFYTPEIKKMVYFLRKPEIDFHKWKFNNNN